MPMQSVRFRISFSQTDNNLFASVHDEVTVDLHFAGDQFTGLSISHFEDDADNSNEPYRRPKRVISRSAPVMSRQEDIADVVKGPGVEIWNYYDNDPFAGASIAVGRHLKDRLPRAHGAEAELQKSRALYDAYELQVTYPITVAVDGIARDADLRGKLKSDASYLVVDTWSLDHNRRKFEVERLISAALRIKDVLIVEATETHRGLISAARD